MSGPASISSHGRAPRAQGTPWPGGPLAWLCAGCPLMLSPPTPAGTLPDEARPRPVTSWAPLRALQGGSKVGPSQSTGGPGPKPLGGSQQSRWGTRVGLLYKHCWFCREVSVELSVQDLITNTHSRMSTCSVTEAGCAVSLLVSATQDNHPLWLPESRLWEGGLDGP